MATRLNIEIRRGKSYGYEMALQQVLSTLLTPPVVEEPVMTEAVTHQAQTLAFLTREVETLRAQVLQMQQERDRASEKTEVIEQMQTELAALQAENVRLKQAQTTLLAAYNQLLSTGQAQAIEPVEETLPQSTPPTQTITPANLPMSPSAPTATGSLKNSTATPVLEAIPTQGRKEGKAKERAKAIFAGLQDWNQTHPDCTFALNAGLLEEIFGINRKAAKEFVAEYQVDISEHHRAIGVVNDRGHNRGKDTGALKSFVDLR